MLADHEAPRPLPRPPRPHNHECWTSYIDRLAHHYSCRPIDIQRHLGTSSRGVTITDEHAEHAGRLLSLNPPDIHAMHLARWAGTALPAPLTTSDIPRAPWSWLPHSRTCPACARERDWTPLHWQLPWITTCLEHPLHLNDPNDTHATRNAPKASLQRTRHFAALLEGHQTQLLGHTVPAADAFAIWRSALHLAEQCQRIPRPTTHRQDCEIALSTASVLVHAPSIEAAAHIIQTWCRDAGIPQPYKSALTKPRSPLMQECVNAATRPRGANTTTRHTNNAHQAAIAWLTALNQSVTPERVAQLRPYVHRYPAGSHDRHVAEALIRGGRTPTRQAITKATSTNNPPSESKSA